MVSKSSQVLLLLIFAILALYAYTERVSADNQYCPADNLENAEHVPYQTCGYDYENCKQWCLDRGKWFADKYVKKGERSGVIRFSTYSGDICVCCCKDAIPGQDPPPSVLPPPRANKYCPANNIEVNKQKGLLTPCGKVDEYDNCADWCIKHFRTYANRIIDGDNCVCCCADATPPPPPPPTPPCLPSSPPPPPPPAALTPPPQECVCALNNKYCPPNNKERLWTVVAPCPDDFHNCKSWCADRGRSYTTNTYKVDRGQIDCVCCCGDALTPPPPPPLPSQG